eukprot:5391918-Prymnesium_polylepis.1
MTSLDFSGAVVPLAAPAFVVTLASSVAFQSVPETFSATMAPSRNTSPNAGSAVVVRSGNVSPAAAPPVVAAAAQPPHTPVEVQSDLRARARSMMWLFASSASNQRS